MFSNILKSYIFQHPNYTEENRQKQNVNISQHHGIPYVLFEKQAEQDLSNSSVLRILYSHGNVDDVVTSFPYLNAFVELLSKFIPQTNIYLMVWDYPTYSTSVYGEDRLEPKYIEEQAEIMWKLLLLKESWNSQKINVSMGSSLGCFAASHVAQKFPSLCDALILTTPYAKLVSGTGHTFLANWVVGEGFDNISKMKNVSSRTEIIAIWVERDKVLPPVHNMEVLSQCNRSFWIDSADHEYCTMVYGVEYMVNTILGPYFKDIMTIHVVKEVVHDASSPISGAGSLDDYAEEHDVEMLQKDIDDLLTL